MLLTIDSASAGVIATIFAALLIAVAVRSPMEPRDDAPRWGKALVVVLEWSYVLTMCLTVTSIVLCLQIVGGGKANPFTDWFVSVNMYLLQLATISWVLSQVGLRFKRDS